MQFNHEHIEGFFSKSIKFLSSNFFSNRIKHILYCGNIPTKSHLLTNTSLQADTLSCVTQVKISDQIYFYYLI